MQGQGFNPMQIIQAIQNGANPQQITMNILQEKMGQTPMGQNLMQLAQMGNSSQLMQIAKNLSNQKGVIFDKEFTAFKNKIGVK